MQGPSIHILFVDDESFVLQSIKRMLRSKREEWALYYAGSVDEAFSIANSTDLDIIVSDYNMPGKDGLELLIESKSHPRLQKVPVVMLTGNAEVDLKRRALENGALDLLSKPVGKEDLIARLQSAIQLRLCWLELEEINAGLERRVRERTLELERTRNELIWRLSYAVEARDEDTGAHITRVAKCTRVIAEQLGLSASIVDELFYASALHDIGKIAIPDAILHKPGKLTLDERATIELHCSKGWEILTKEAELPGMDCAQNPLLELAAEIVLSHHEKWDGSGYPSGILGEKIPISGRIVAAADVLDALCSKRAYKESIPFSDSFQRVLDMSGSHFDPEVIEACKRCEEQLHEILQPGSVLDSSTIKNEWRKAS